MALLDAEVFCQPLSADQPCGPDLDATFDIEFSSFLARIEGELPMSFFAFKRDQIDYRAELDTVRALSRRTRDLRLLVIYAKLAALDRDLAAFANALGIIAQILAERWEHVHPRPDNGRLDLRLGTLMALDDLPQVVIPLQYLSLAESRRTGPVTYRMVQIGTGKITPREGEAAVDLDTIERVFLEQDAKAVRDRHDLFAGVVAAIDGIDAATMAGGGEKARIRLAVLEKTARDIIGFLDAQLARIDPVYRPPSPVSPTDEGETGATDADVPAPIATRPVAALASRAEAITGLRATEAYFEHCEPSNPALAVVRFARQLMGKPFFEVLRLIVPDHAARAEIRFGTNAFRLPLEHLSGAQEASNDDGADALDEVGVPLIETREEAQRMLDQVASFLCAAEPSNPVPLLLARARDLAVRDFSALLRDMFTEDALRAMKGND
ncbi:ImpA family type VI secretion system protein [Xanthobacter oligotrophicus]|uniref:type VI secretion system protein TssA n=1 Tax=Xanthobacter oligotrophicus TaxID=2607286 RepID=UPI0011F0A4CE|nr:type VI secretion system ImpA family N-terminal domain-containing protein [Xanthobacter oligotrophicus]MCG5233956.1 type VI secretion system ImpA family N-terminal domain-containing protein [Xanthobacter oligotrophicus]